MIGDFLVASAPAFNRPANTTAYASGDLVANDVDAADVIALVFQVARDSREAIAVLRARLRKSGTSTTSAAFRLHLFSRRPTVANGDNGAFSPNQSAYYLGAIDFANTDFLAMSDGSVCQGAPLIGNSIVVRTYEGADIYGLLEARGAYTPASGETFNVELEVV